MTGAPVAAGQAPATSPLTVGAALAAARNLIAAGDARVLLSHALQRDAAHLIAHDRDVLDAHSRREFEAFVARRAAGVPVAYLTGRREFFGIEFRVTPSVLIPRPETELLVELALEQLPADAPCQVLDLGTGSGCVALSIARYRPQATVLATDRSPEALATARLNADELQLPHVAFAAGTWFAAAADRVFDLIVSNPPYVAMDDPCLGVGDLRFEPQEALHGGAGGFDALRAIAGGARAHMAAGGALLLEHGCDQGTACRDLLRAAGFRAVFTRRDLSGHERVTGGLFDGERTNR